MVWTDTCVVRKLNKAESGWITDQKGEAQTDPYDSTQP